VLKRATLTGSDDPNHIVRRQRIYRHLRYRTRRAGRLSCLPFWSLLNDAVATRIQPEARIK